MKLKNSFFYTLRENVRDEELVSSNLLVRAGFIKKSSAGVYMMLPLGLRVMQKIEEIIRQEMDATGCQEVLMPSLIPEEVYVSSGRREGFGSSMFALKDRKGQDYVLGPTHEELFALAAKMKIRSYKDMPFSLYQMQTKFRDEPRPRFGLIRVREFIMKDAYTFDMDEAGLDAAYAKQFNAYKNIMDRLHLDYRIVRADTGVMGGLLSEEFQAITPIGEDVLVLCDSCDFASNIEVAPCIPQKPEVIEEEKEMYLEETPNSRTIEEVAEHFHLDAKKFVKTLIYSVDGNPVAVMVRGDRDVNETKLRKMLNATNVELADADTVVRVTGAQVGFAGPIGIDCPVYMDRQILKMHNFIVGANKTDHHYENVNVEDFQPEAIADLCQVKEGDVCPVCGKPLTFEHGIEVGNLFKLGTKYSKSLNVLYTDQDNQQKPIWMGCYGIGLERCMAAVAEQYNDEKGLMWPDEVAPFRLAIVVISNKDDRQMEVADQLYDFCKKHHYDVLLDDRKERPGVKFKDMELIGIPHRITVGRGVKDGMLEWTERSTGEKREVSLDDIEDRITEIYEK
ncbi:MAG TPA: proline--tRNA ligase [Erysipelotrichaceae bacterium]|nr:proline--tRNA ligase [Erysipelotrichaceae bacterium]